MSILLGVSPLLFDHQKKSQLKLWQCRDWKTGRYCTVWETTLVPHWLISFWVKVILNLFMTGLHLHLYQPGRTDQSCSEKTLLHSVSAWIGVACRSSLLGKLRNSLYCPQQLRRI